MGLDISLYQVDDFEQMIIYYQERDSRFSEWHEGQDHYAWGDCVELFPPYSGERKISFKHSRFPEHDFNVGHFNLSFTGGGIFRVLRSEITGVRYVFERPEGVVRFRPDWLLCLERVRKLKELKEAILANVKLENDSEDRVFYSEALDIFNDTVEYVLGQKDPELHYLCWL